MSGEKNKKPHQLTLPSSTIVAFLVGVVIPLLAAAIPPTIEYFHTRNDFTYFREDPVFFKGRVAYSLQVSNQGRVVERDVQVWLAASKDDEVIIEADPVFARGVSPIRIHDEAGYKVVSLGDMRAGEIFRLSIMKTWKSISTSPEGTLDSYPAFVEKILSSERIAKFVPKKGTVWERSSPSLTWFSSLAVFLLGLSVLFAYITLTRNGTSDVRQKGLGDEQSPL